MISILEAAWQWREKAGVFLNSQAVRVFHGPGEGSGALSDVMIDRFMNSFWVTLRTLQSPQGDNEAISVVSDFLKNKGASCAVLLERPRGALPVLPRVLFGSPSPAGEIVEEEGARFWVRLQGTRHPGLFLDHAPLRGWLRQHMKGLKVLNTFAYTGSLSVAAALGGAQSVVTLDLSKPSISWARENWELNKLAPEKARFIAGDMFEWLPRFQKKNEKFDCVILDPPSFSRTKRGSFSTVKDLKKLHTLALDVLIPGGILVTSINSESVPRETFESEVFSTIRALHRKAKILWKIQLPETFPLPPRRDAEAYLKGLILRVK